MPMIVSMVRSTWYALLSNTAMRVSLSQDSNMDDRSWIASSWDIDIVWLMSDGGRWVYACSSFLILCVVLRALFFWFISTNEEEKKLEYTSIVNLTSKAYEKSNNLFERKNSRNQKFPPLEGKRRSEEKAKNKKQLNTRPHSGGGTVSSSHHRRRRSSDCAS